MGERFGEVFHAQRLRYVAQVNNHMDGLSRTQIKLVVHRFHLFTYFVGLGCAPMFHKQDLIFNVPLDTIVHDDGFPALRH